MDKFKRDISDNQSDIGILARNLIDNNFYISNETPASNEILHGLKELWTLMEECSAKAKGQLTNTETEEYFNG